MGRRREPRPRVQITGSVAVVTGAGRGIGRSIALALARRGAVVACADIHADLVEKVAAECEEAGAPAASSHVVDVSTRAAVEGLAAEVEATHGSASIVVNNAGVGMSGRFADMSADDWEWIRSVNLDGVWHGCSAFAPHLLGGAGGHVINLSSGLGYTITATEPAYVTTKAAVLALSQCLRADWAAEGVGVTAICPGVIDTPIVEHTRFVADDGTARRRAKRIFKRGHSPDKVAAAVIDAIERDRAVVTVGIEAKFGWWLHRLAPLTLTQAMARAGRR